MSIIVPVYSTAASSSSSSVNPSVYPAVTTIDVNVAGVSTGVNISNDDEDAEMDIESVDHVTLVSSSTTSTSGGRDQLPVVSTNVQDNPPVNPIYTSDHSYSIIRVDSYNTFRLATLVNNLENVYIIIIILFEHRLNIIYINNMVYSLYGENCDD